MRLSIEQYSSLLLYYSYYWKLLGKYCQTITHVLFHYSTVYTVVLSTLLFTSLILLLSLYRPSILNNMDIDCVNWINNNVKRQLTLGLGKLMEEIVSVFWVDLGCTLHSRLMFPMQNSGGWLTSYLFIISQCYCEYYFTVSTVYYYWLPGGRVCFSARHLGRGPGYVRNPHKALTMSPTNQFQ